MTAAAAAAAAAVVVIVAVGDTAVQGMVITMHAMALTIQRKTIGVAALDIDTTANAM